MINYVENLYYLDLSLKRRKGGVQKVTNLKIIDEKARGFGP
jgi:hypothetical protein